MGDIVNSQDSQGRSDRTGGDAHSEVDQPNKLRRQDSLDQRRIRQASWSKIVRSGANHLPVVIISSYSNVATDRDISSVHDDLSRASEEKRQQVEVSDVAVFEGSGARTYRGIASLRVVADRNQGVVGGRSSAERCDRYGKAEIGSDAELELLVVDVVLIPYRDNGN